MVKSYLCPLCLAQAGVKWWVAGPHSLPSPLHHTCVSEAWPPGCGDIGFFRRFLEVGIRSLECNLAGWKPYPSSLLPGSHELNWVLLSVPIPPMMDCAVTGLRTTNSSHGPEPLKPQSQISLSSSKVVDLSYRDGELAKPACQRCAVPHWLVQSVCSSDHSHKN